MHKHRAQHTLRGSPDPGTEAKHEVLVVLALLSVFYVQLLCVPVGAMQDGISAEPGKRNQTCSAELKAVSRGISHGWVSLFDNPVR